FTPDGKRLVAWVANSVIQVFDVANGSPVKSFSGHESQVVCLAFSPDGQFAALGDQNGTVRLWRVDKEEQLGGDLAAHSEGITDLAFTPDKKFLVTGGAEGEVKVWDLGNRSKPLHAVKAHPQKVVTFAVSADGKRFVTTGGENTVKC